MNEEKKNQHKSEKKEEDNEGKSDELSDSFKGRKKYKDVADAAQAAFESAAYAAAAARAAVELSRFQPHDPHYDNDNGSSPQSREVLNGHDHSVKAMSPLEGEESNKNAEELEKAKDTSSSNSDGDSVDEEIVLESKMQSTPFIDLEKKPFSVRTKRVQGY